MNALKGQGSAHGNLENGGRDEWHGPCFTIPTSTIETPGKQPEAANEGDSRRGSDHTSQPHGDGRCGFGRLDLPPRGEWVASHDPPARPLPTPSVPRRNGARGSSSRSESFVQVAMGEVVDLNRALWPAFLFHPFSPGFQLQESSLSFPEVRGLPDLREKPSFQEAPGPMRRTSRSASPASKTTSGLGHRRTEIARRFSAFASAGRNGPGSGASRGSHRLPPR